MGSQSNVSKRLRYWIIRILLGLGTKKNWMSINCSVCIESDTHFSYPWFRQKMILSKQKNCFPNDECTIQIVTENPSRIFSNLMMSNLVIFCKKIFPQTIPWVNKRHLKNLGKFYWNQVCTPQKYSIVHCIDKFLMFINFRNCGMFVI